MSKRAHSPVSSSRHAKRRHVMVKEDEHHEDISMDSLVIEDVSAPSPQQQPSHLKRPSNNSGSSAAAKQNAKRRKIGAASVVGRKRSGDISAMTLSPKKRQKTLSDEPIVSVTPEQSLLQTAGIHMNARQPALALPLLQQALASSPPGTLQHKIQGRLCRCLISLGLAEQAVEYLSADPTQELALQTLLHLSNSAKEQLASRQWHELLESLNGLKLIAQITSPPINWIVWECQALCGLEKWQSAESLSRQLPYPANNHFSFMASFFGGQQCQPDQLDNHYSAHLLDYLQALNFPGTQPVEFIIPALKSLINHHASSGNQNWLQTQQSTINRMLGEALLKNHSYTEAIQVFSVAWELRRSSDHELEDLIAICFYNNNEYRNAAKWSNVAAGHGTTNASLRDAIQMQQDSKPPWEILGCDPNADLAQIKKAYRRAALMAHPDKGGVKEDFARVAQAFETMTDKFKT